jgi:hypothetical protein
MKSSNHILNIINYFIILFTAYASFNTKEEAVARMFVELVWIYLGRADRKGMSQALSP